MELQRVGETCVLDFSDLAKRIQFELHRYDEKVTRNDRPKIDDLISTMADDYLTMGMYWTKRRAEFPQRKYLDLIRPLIQKHPSPSDILHMASDRIADMLAEVVVLPTWHLLHVHCRRGMMEIELGEDYRIVDWMKKHAAEYGVTQPEDGYDW